MQLFVSLSLSLFLSLSFSSALSLSLSFEQHISPSSLLVPQDTGRLLQVRAQDILVLVLRQISGLAGLAIRVSPGLELQVQGGNSGPITTWIKLVSCRRGPPDLSNSTDGAGSVHLARHAKLAQLPAHMFCQFWSGLSSPPLLSIISKSSVCAP